MVPGAKGPAQMTQQDSSAKAKKIKFCSRCGIVPHPDSPTINRAFGANLRSLPLGNWPGAGLEWVCRTCALGSEWNTYGVRRTLIGTCLFRWRPASRQHDPKPVVQVSILEARDGKVETLYEGCLQRADHESEAILRFLCARAEELRTQRDFPEKKPESDR